MEPVTHFLTGACLGRAGFNRLSGLATLTLTLAAEAPDIDIISSYWGPVAGFEHHRGFSHTFLGAPVIAGLVVGFIWLLQRQRIRRKRTTQVPVRWGVLYLLALFGALSHILLDFTNNYGVRPFEPFNSRWYSWDIVFVVEPVLLVALTLGLVLPALFGLVAGEIGAKRDKLRGRGWAIVALSAMVGFWFVRDVQHRQAVAMLNSRQMATGDTLRVGAMPYPVNPFHWFGVVETPRAIETYDVQTHRLAVESYGREGTYFKAAESPETRAAKQSWLGRVYLDWARFPVLEVTPEADDARVVFRDVRYLYSPLPSRSNRDARNVLGAMIVLDRNDRVVEQWMGDREQR
jgi:inner membrane protein